MKRTFAIIILAAGITVLAVMLSGPGYDAGYDAGSLDGESTGSIKGAEFGFELGEGLFKQPTVDSVASGEYGTISIDEAIKSSEVASRRHAQIALDAGDDIEEREFHIYWARLHQACADYLMELR